MAMAASLRGTESLGGAVSKVKDGGSILRPVRPFCFWGRRKVNTLDLVSSQSVPPLPAALSLGSRWCFIVSSFLQFVHKCCRAPLETDLKIGNVKGKSGERNHRPRPGPARPLDAMRGANSTETLALRHWQRAASPKPPLIMSSSFASGLSVFCPHSELALSPVCLFLDRGSSDETANEIVLKHSLSHAGLEGRRRRAKSDRWQLRTQ